MKQTKRRRAKKQRRPGQLSRKKFVPPTTMEEFFAMPQHERDLWNKVGHVVTEVRTGASLHRAAQKFGLNVRRVRQLAPAAFRKLKNGRYAAKAFDRLLRVLVIPTRKELREIGVRDSRQSTLVAEYWSAVERYLATGDVSALRKFRGKHIIDSNGRRIPLLTNRGELDRLGSAGVFSFESIYASAA